MFVREVVKRAKSDNLPISEYALRRLLCEDKIPCARMGKKALLYYSNVVHYLTLMIAGHQDLRTVASRLGHAQASTTMNIYAHALKENDRKAVNALESMLRE